MDRPTEGATPMLTLSIACVLEGAAILYLAHRKDGFGKGETR